MFSTKNLTCLFLVLLIAAPSAMALDVWFVGTMNSTGDDWGDPNNWIVDDGNDYLPGLPTAVDTAVFGYGADSYARVYSGVATSGTLEMSRGDNAGVTIDAGATLNVYSRFIMGYSELGGADADNYMTVNGEFNVYGGNINVGAHHNNTFTINEGGYVGFGAWAYFGRGYGSTSDVGNDFANTTVYHNGGILETTYDPEDDWPVNTISLWNDGGAHTMHYLWSGGTINTNYDAGMYTYGGTFEVAGQTEFNGARLAFNAIDANVLNPDTSVWEFIPGDVTLKFSGVDPKLTMVRGDLALGRDDDPDPNVDPNTLGRTYQDTKIDITSLTLSQNDTWTTVADVQAGDIWWVDDIVLVDGGDANWYMRYVDANGNQQQYDANGDRLKDANGDEIDMIQMQFLYGEEPQDCVPSIADIAPVASGGDGIVDGADLGALLARWKDTGPSIADIAPVGPGLQDGIVDGADLGALLARWKDTTVCPEAAPAVPEPATISLLALAGVGLLRRRSAQVLRRRKR